MMKKKSATPNDRTKAWLEEIFAAKIAQVGGVVRRKKTSVEMYASLKEFKDAVRVPRVPPARAD